MRKTLENKLKEQYCGNSVFQNYDFLGAETEKFFLRKYDVSDKI